METNNCPLVSVPVITYNSSKTILETLESVKAQTYQNVELVISDDCSTDNTISICQKWIEENNNRFVRTEIITSSVNTGISSNLNRAENACHGDWVKGIAGDDILMPDCISTCMEYVKSHQDVVYLFGRIKCFGTDENICAEVESRFDYSFFSLSPENQLHRLLFEGNCIPASTSFYNKEKTSVLGVVNDERIPLLEDWPKWINLIKKGCIFHFVDTVLVRYRVGGISSNGLTSLNYFKTKRLFFFYYQYPEYQNENYDTAVRKVVDVECNYYSEILRLRHQLDNIHSTLIYRCYSKLIFPLLKLIKMK